VPKPASAIACDVNRYKRPYLKPLPKVTNRKTPKSGAPRVVVRYMQVAIATLSPIIPITRRRGHTSGRRQISIRSPTATARYRTNRT
jgi:hypothetical protein